MSAEAVHRWRTAHPGETLTANALREALDVSLYWADLREADLRGAYPIGCLGLYSVRPPFMSSRNDALYAGVFERDGGLVLLFSAGCQHQQTAAELREKVRETHGMNAHAVQYEAAITFIEVCFASDMAEGRFAVKEAQP